MKRFRPWVAGVGLCAAVAPAAALVIDFESALPSGFTLSNGVTTFADGATDGGEWFDQLAYVGATVGGRIFDNTDGTAMGFTHSAQPPLGPAYSVGFSPGSGFAGFSGVSFQYSASDLTQVRFTDASENEVTVKSVVVSGTLLGAGVPTVTLQDGTSATYNLAGQFSGDTCSNLVRGSYCNWTNVNFLLAGTATTMHFNNNGTLGTALFDNYDFKMEQNVPGSGPALVPEPSTYALMALGLLGIALKSRRRRESRVVSAVPH